REIGLPLVDVLVHMEEAGIKVDTRYLATLAAEFTGEVARIEREAHDAVGHEFGINSPKQLQELLFTELKLPRGRRTGTGYSTDAAVLEELRGAHPVIDKILEYRGREAAFDVRRGPRAAHRSRRPDPHDLQPDGGVDRPAFQSVAEPPEHPDPHAARTADPARVHRGSRRSDLARRGLLADRTPRPRACLGR